MAVLLDSLREAAAHEQAAALLARDPAAHAPLDDPGGVADLLTRLREVGAHEQAARAAAHAPLDDPRGAAELLDSMREAAAHEQPPRLYTGCQRPASMNSSSSTKPPETSSISG